MHPIDEVRLAFDPSSLRVLNVVLGLVMFGVALDLKVDDFRHLWRQPRAPLLGMFAQFLVLPALTTGLAALVAPTPSMALGMILVSACPGGNVSNFITHVARGRTSTSVGMTVLSTAAAVVMTPLNLTFWGTRRPETAALVESFALDPLQMLATVAVLIAIPCAIGMSVAAWLPALASWLRRPFKVLSLLFFVAFVGIAFANNFQFFIDHIGKVFLPVAVMNAVALSLGYGIAWAGGCDEGDRRAVSIEVGIQNSGLGLIIVFGFFGGLGGMAIVAAWWGIWHIIAGLSLAAWWQREPAVEPAGA